MPVPEPNSPEAKRAADKVRSVFFFIAAANLVIIALVMWPRPKLPDAQPPNAPKDSAATADPTLAAMEAALERLLDAYHARDAERFAEAFSAAVTPPIDEEYFRTVIIGEYHENFGEITHREPAAESNRQEIEPVLVHTIQARKAPTGKMITRFQREGDGYKPIGWELRRE